MLNLTNPQGQNYNAAGNVQYNYAQLEGIWTQAGGPAGAAPIAAAIAMAESSGNTTATNIDSNGSVDRGLWQINSVHGTQSTYDVMGNARAAIAISNGGTNWTPWTTYTNGAYRQYLQANIPADTSAPINGTNAAANATLLSYPGGQLDPANYLDPFGFFGKIFNLPSSAANAVDKQIATAMQGAVIAILNPFIQMVAGIMGIGAGGVMVLVGIWMIARSTETGQQVERGVGAGARVGAAVLAPETAATTEYRSGGQLTSTVTQRRRQAVRVRGIQFRPGRVSTTVDRPEGSTGGRRGTRDQLVNEANGYQRRGPIHGPGEAA